ncbi:MAG: hypothetical protein AB7T49_15970 [Oligoflexales bacterium]
MQSFLIYVWYLKSLIRRVAVDFYREITVLLSCIVLLALFGYVFFDFLTAKAVEIPAQTHANFVFLAMIVFASLVTKIVVGSVKSDAFKQFGSQLLVLGENPKNLSRARLWHNAVTLATLVTVYIVVCKEWLEGLTISQVSGLILSQILLGALFSLISVRAAPQRRRSLYLWTNHRIWTMVKWRSVQMAMRNPVTRFNLLFAALLALAAWLFLARGTAFILVFLLAFLSGLVAASQLFLQLKEDLSGGWAEKLMGVSHADYLRCYYLLALIFTAGFVLIATPFLVIGPSDRIELGKVVAAQVTPVLLAPGLLFQIDARRPFIQVSVLFLVGLFVATAILAHFLSVVLVPIVGYYTAYYERDLYYRA